MKARSSRNRRGRKIATTVLVVVGVIVCALLLPRLFQVVSTVVLSPFIALHSWVTTSSDTVPLFVRDRLALRGEIEVLENQLAVAGGENLTLDRLRNENNRLRSLLGANATDRLAAAVVARPNQVPYDLLQLDRGSDHGIVVGAPVYIGEDRLLGLIADVGSTHSFVVLLTHPDFSATGFIEGANIIAAIDGVGGGVARVRVPQGVPLTVGDVVHVPSIEPGVFGRVVSVENRPTQPEQYGYITPDFPLSSIHLVSIGREPIQPATVSVVTDRVLQFIASSTLVLPFASSTASTTITASTSTSTP